MYNKDYPVTGGIIESRGPFSVIFVYFCKSMKQNVQNPKE